MPEQRIKNQQQWELLASPWALELNSVKDPSRKDLALQKETTCPRSEDWSFCNFNGRTE
jgi:hypothetical protein